MKKKDIGYELSKLLEELENDYKIKLDPERIEEKYLGTNDIGWSNRDIYTARYKISDNVYAYFHYEFDSDSMENIYLSEDMDIKRGSKEKIKDDLYTFWIYNEIYGKGKDISSVDYLRYLYKITDNVGGLLLIPNVMRAFHYLRHMKKDNPDFISYVSKSKFDENKYVLINISNGEIAIPAVSSNFIWQHDKYKSNKKGFYITKNLAETIKALKPLKDKINDETMKRFIDNALGKIC